CLENVNLHYGTMPPLCTWRQLAGISRVLDFTFTLLLQQGHGAIVVQSLLQIQFRSHFTGSHPRRALEFGHFDAIRTRPNATRLGGAGELSVSLLNRDSCNEASFSPKGIHKSAQ